MRTFFIIFVFFLCVGGVFSADEHTFAINDKGGKVVFSPGNLQFNAALGEHKCADGKVKKGTWRFAEHQCDYVGGIYYFQSGSVLDSSFYGTVYVNGQRCNNCKKSESYNGWVDLFGFATSGWDNTANDPLAVNFEPWSLADTNSSNTANMYGYGPSTTMPEHNIVGTSKYYDWGEYNQIGSDDPGTWRLLTANELNYLLYDRPNADKLRSLGNIYLTQRINQRTTRSNRIEGLILLPDDWVLPDGMSFDPNSNSYYDNNYTIDETSSEEDDAAWAKMEAAGAVFISFNGRLINCALGLVIAKYRRFDIKEINPYWSQYWTSTHTPYAIDPQSQLDGPTTCALSFVITSCSVDYEMRGDAFGCSVRLVKDVSSEHGDDEEEEPQVETPKDGLKFFAQTANDTVALVKYGAPADVALQYSLNGAAWTDYTIGDKIIIPAIGDSLLFKANTENRTFSTSINDYYNFVTTGDITLAGKITYLLSSEGKTDSLPAFVFNQLFAYSSVVSIADSLLPDTTLAEWCYYGMFHGCTSLTSLPQTLLPATTLAEGCYSFMFDSCINIVNLPVLPATTLAIGCYYAMFQRCSSLTALPDKLLPATSLTYACYGNMFFECTALTALPDNLLPATSLATGCYYGMFSGCSALTSLPEHLLPATALDSSSYYGMFNRCIGIKTLPATLLPATTLAYCCYDAMFSGCTGLTSLPETLLPATTLTIGCYAEMFLACTGLTSLPEKLLPATTLADSCYLGMFMTCTSLTALPDSLLPADTLTKACYTFMFGSNTSLTTLPDHLLPATALAEGCYFGMFLNCSSLCSLPDTLLPATTLATGCYYNMFKGCLSLVNAPLLPATSLVQDCYTQMFKNCSNLQHVQVAFTQWSTESTDSWLEDVHPTGTFAAPCALSIDRGYAFIPEYWNVNRTTDNCEETNIDYVQDDMSKGNPITKNIEKGHVVIKKNNVKYNIWGGKIQP